MHANARLNLHGRRLLIDRIQQGRPVAHVADELGISRQTAYKWWGRWRREGDVGLRDRSSRPRSCPNQTSRQLERRVERLRRSRKLGPARIAGIVDMPASTVHQVLVRRGLVDHQPRRREPPGGWRRFTRPCCNDLWHIDATRHLLAGGRGFWVIDLVDDHSRFLLAAHVAAAPAMRPGWDAFRGAVAACGLPRQLISDNGINFTGRLHGRTVAFERQVAAGDHQVGIVEHRAERMAQRITQLAAFMD